MPTVHLVVCKRRLCFRNDCFNTESEQVAYALFSIRGGVEVSRHKLDGFGHVECERCLVFFCTQGLAESLLRESFLLQRWMNQPDACVDCDILYYLPFNQRLELNTKEIKLRRSSYLTFSSTWPWKTKNLLVGRKPRKKWPVVKFSIYNSFLATPDSSTLDGSQPVGF